MLVEAAIKNISDNVESLAGVDWLDLTWIDCRKRFAKKFTRSGGEVRIMLSLRQKLAHGDLLGTWPDGKSVVVNLLPANVFCIRPRNATESISTAFQLGNLHVPIQVDDTGFLVPCTDPVERMLLKFDLQYETQQRQFAPALWPEFVQISADFRIISKSAETIARSLP